MLLVVDPQEPILRNLANDGGSRFIQSNPRTPQQAMTDPTFNYGKVIACSFGPDAQTPDFSFFAADLRGAYSDKVTACVRRFCFLNLHQPGHPAAMILLDDITAKDPAFKKYWQLTTLKPPRTTPGGLQLSNESGGLTGRLDVRLLSPGQAERTVEIERRGRSPRGRKGFHAPAAGRARGQRAPDSRFPVRRIRTTVFLPSFRPVMRNRCRLRTRRPKTSRLSGSRIAWSCSRREPCCSNDLSW